MRNEIINRLSKVTGLLRSSLGVAGLCFLLSGLDTRAATRAPYVIKNINTANSSEPGGFLTVGGLTYFRADDGVHGSELWSTDGTERGTLLAADVDPGKASSFPASLTVFGGRLFFTATTASTGREVWFTTGRGAHLLKDINAGPPDGVDTFGRVFFPSGRDLYFRGFNELGLELWRSNGTPDGTALVKDIHPGAQWSVPVYLSELRGEVIFAADDLYTPNLLCFDRELWKTNGTEQGTTRVKDIHPGPCPSIPGEITAFGDIVLFSAGDGVLGSELWRSDGSESGTMLVRDINPGPGASFPMQFRQVGQRVFFAAHDGVAGFELWKTDGTAHGTTRVTDINPGSPSSQPFGLTPFRNGVLFTAEDGEHGHEPWFSDGTEHGTALVVDIVPGRSGSTPMEFVVAGGVAYFVIRADFDPIDGSAATELWETDGTNSGTRAVWRAPGRSLGQAIRELTVGRSHLLFVAPTAVDPQGRSVDFEPYAMPLEMK